MAAPRSSLSPLYRLFAPDRADFATILVYAAFAGLFTLAIPVAVQQLVGSVAFGALLQPIFVLAVLLLAVLALTATLRALEAWVVERLQERVFVRVAMRFVTRLTQSTSGATGTRSRPELLNRFFDVITVHKALAKLAADGLAVTLQTVVGLVALAFYHPWLLAFGAVLSGLLAFVLGVLGRGAIRTSYDESNAKYALAAWLEEIARNPALFRGAAARWAGQRAEAAARAWVTDRRGHFRVVFRQTIGLLSLQALASAGLLTLGGVLVIKRQLTLGQLIAAELIVSALASGIGKFGRSLDAAYDLVTAAIKLAQVEDELPPETDGRAAPAPVEGGAALRLAGVTLEGDGRPLTRGLSLELEPGERAALVGPSGVGKSAVLDLVHGDWDGPPPTGLIELDGLDLRSWRRSELRERVALVRAGTLFPGSIEENVALGRPGVGPLEVQRALEAVGLWEKIAAHPAGLARLLRGDGPPLSRGEALLLVVARALAGAPRLVLVDSLADLDPAARARVLALLHDPTRPMTVLFAASDPAVVGPCARIVPLTEVAPASPEAA